MLQTMLDDRKPGDRRGGRARQGSRETVGWISLLGPNFTPFNPAATQKEVVTTHKLAAQ